MSVSVLKKKTKNDDDVLAFSYRNGITFLAILLQSFEAKWYNYNMIWIRVMSFCPTGLYIMDEFLN